MITKEELLQKGMSEADADEIISKLETDSEDNENSLQALQKALDSNDSNEEILSKADGGDEEESEGKEDDYDEKYMKKYMKRYMKANKASCQKMMKELGSANEKMNKAIDDVDIDSEGAVVEMTDLAPYLENQKEFNESMVKAIETMSEMIEVISSQNEKSYDLMKKAATVQVEQAEAIGDYFSKPQGRKGVVASESLAKASEESNIAEPNVIYQKLFKAVKEGDKQAGQVISAFESAGKNIKFLNNAHKNYIQNLLKGDK